MRNTRQVSVAAALAAVMAWTGSARAVSFTFDYQHPTGAGSGFSDAVSLNTIGALTDSIGQAIGFTTLGAGGTGGLTLGAGGLAWDTSVSNVLMGIPAPTDGAGNVKITARFSGSTGDWDSNFEQISTGWAPGAATGIGDLLQGIVFFNSGSDTGGDNIIVQARLPDGTPNVNNAATADIQELSISAPATAGSSTAVQFVGNGGSPVANASITDGQGTNPDRLGQSDSYAWFLVGGGGDGFTGTLTSITVEGPNVSAPAVNVVPEPASATLALLGLGTLALRRRRAA